AAELWERMRRDGGSVFTAQAKPGGPNGPLEGLTANENVCALISMVARSTARSNQRPDTLMQDRKLKKPTVSSQNASVANASCRPALEPSGMIMPRLAAARGSRSPRASGAIAVDTTA